MNRHLIIGCIGTQDRPVIVPQNNQVVHYLDLAPDGQLIYGIGKVLSDLYTLNIYPSEIGLDLLMLATLVQAADNRISRSKHAQDSWTREISLCIPVSNITVWSGTKDLLQRMLSFLSGDYWEINFRQRPQATTNLVRISSAELIPPDFNSLALFSGGLDSTIDAINQLSKPANSLLISYAGDSAASSAQTKILGKLKVHYPNVRAEQVRLAMRFERNFFPEAGTENSMRARSFIFFSLGVMASTGLSQIHELRVPENGLIALNVPLDGLRLGSLSTRTTHPYYMARWNELLQILNIPLKVVNSHWNKTKGEMVANCMDKNMLQNLLNDTSSCSAPNKGRFTPGSAAYGHCGYCLPCLIRRASVNAGLGNGVDTTTYTRTDADFKSKVFSTKSAEGKQIRSFQLAITKLRGKPSSANLLIHKSGPLDDVSPHWDELAGVYARGLEEVALLVEDVKTDYN